MARKSEIRFSWTWVHETEDGAEGIDLDVKAEVTGRYVPAKLYGDGAHEAEHPEVEVVEALDSDGVDCLGLLSAEDVRELETLAELEAADAEADRYNDEMERRADAAEDR